MKLTERRSRDLKARERQYIVYDKDLAGFGVRVAPSGSKSWIVRYRIGGGRGSTERMMTLGRIGVLRADEAREMAREILVEARKGGDPFGLKQQRRAAPTVSELLDRYLTDHAPRKSIRSRAEDTRLIERHLRPALGRKKVAEVEREDIERLHRRMKATPVQANRVLALASKVFQLAEKWRMRPDVSNPTRHVDRYPEKGRERYFAPSEIAALGSALNDLEEAGANPASILAIRLAAVTGLRIGEVRTLRWADVRLETGTLTASGKTGSHFIALPSFAQRLLAGAPKLGGNVIPGRDPDTPLDYKAIHSVWAKARDHAGLQDARIHDLRHTVATMAAETGAGAHLVRDLIGHKSLAMANLYVGRMARPVADLRERIGGAIGAAMQGRADAGVEAVGIIKK